MLGISARYIQDFEAGRPIPDWLLDEIMLRFGIDPDSLRQEAGWPISLLDTDRFNFTYRDPDLGDGPGDSASDEEIAESMLNAIDSAVALNRKITRLQKIRDKNERLKISIELWQQYATLSQSEAHQSIEEVLVVKLSLLRDAARQKGSYLAAALQLSNWIEKAVELFGLRKTINELRAKRTDWPPVIELLRNEWPSFADLLGAHFWLQGEDRIKPLAGRGRRNAIRSPARRQGHRGG
jgi:hypothetical protein